MDADQGKAHCNPERQSRGDADPRMMRDEFRNGVPGVPSNPGIEQCRGYETRDEASSEPID